MCENVALYAKKYNEEEVEFAKHLPMFVQDIWGLLVTTSDDRCNDYVCGGWELGDNPVRDNGLPLFRMLHTFYSRQ